MGGSEVPRYVNIIYSSHTSVHKKLRKRHPDTSTPEWRTSPCHILQPQSYKPRLAYDKGRVRVINGSFIKHEQHMNKIEYWGRWITIIELHASPLRIRPKFYLWMANKTLESLKNVYLVGFPKTIKRFSERFHQRRGIRALFLRIETVYLKFVKVFLFFATELPFIYSFTKFTVN